MPPLASVQACFTSSQSTIGASSLPHLSLDTKAVRNQTQTISGQTSSHLLQKWLWFAVYCCHLLASFLDLFTKSNSAKGFGSNKLGISQTEIRLWTEKKHRDVSFLFPSYSFPILFIQGLGSDDTRTAVTSGLGCWHICQARSHPRHSCCLPLQSLQNGRISLLLLPCAHTNHFHRPPSYLVATSCSNEFMLQTCETADVQFMSIYFETKTICPWQERLWPSPLCHSSGLGTAQGLKVNLPTVSSYPRAILELPCLTQLTQHS